MLVSSPEELLAVLVPFDAVKLRTLQVVVALWIKNDIKIIHPHHHQNLIITKTLSSSSPSASSACKVGNPLSLSCTVDQEDVERKACYC